MLRLVPATILSLALIVAPAMAQVSSSPETHGAPHGIDHHATPMPLPKAHVPPPPVQNALAPPHRRGPGGGWYGPHGEYWDGRGDHPHWWWDRDRHCLLNIGPLHFDCR